MKIVEFEPLILGRLILVRVHTEEGLRGIGECSPMNAAVPAVRMPQEFSLASITGERRLSGLLREPNLTVQDGCPRVPDGPRRGIELDDRKLAELRTA